MQSHAHQSQQKSDVQDARNHVELFTDKHLPHKTVNAGGNIFIYTLMEKQGPFDFQTTCFGLCMVSCFCMRTESAYHFTNNSMACSLLAV